MHIKNILVPHAGTVLGDRALSYAIYVAKHSGATINILHAIEPLPKPPLFVFSKSDEKRIQNEIKGITDAFADDIKDELEKRVRFCNSKNINANYVVVTGSPENEILKFSKARHIDLLIMAKRRRIPGIKGVLKLGSVTRKILEASGKPVLIIE